MSFQRPLCTDACSCFALLQEQLILTRLGLERLKGQTIMLTPAGPATSNGLVNDNDDNDDNDDAVPPVQTSGSRTGAAVDDPTQGGYMFLSQAVAVNVVRQKRLEKERQQQLLQQQASASNPASQALFSSYFHESASSSLADKPKRRARARAAPKAPRRQTSLVLSDDSDDGNEGEAAVPQPLRKNDANDDDDDNDDNDDDDDTPLEQFRYRKRGATSPTLSQHSLYSQQHRHADKEKAEPDRANRNGHKAASTGLDLLQFSHSGGTRSPPATMAMPSVGSQSQDKPSAAASPAVQADSRPVGTAHNANPDSSDPLAAFNFQQARRRPRAKRTEHGEIARPAAADDEGGVEDGGRLPPAKSAKGVSLLASKQVHKSDVDLLAELGVPKQVAQAGPVRKKKGFS